MRKTLASFLFMAIFFSQLSGQQIIKGVVLDDTKEPLPGVSVQVKNTYRGTITDLNGNYSIAAQPADTLAFNMVGMVMQSEYVGSRTTINITPVSYTHLRAHETVLDLVCRLLLEKKKNKQKTKIHTSKHTQKHNKPQHKTKKK